MPSPDVATWVRFLGVQDNKFVAGTEVTALVGMHNSGDKTFNVSYVGAHLHSPYDQNFYVRSQTHTHGRASRCVLANENACPFHQACFALHPSLNPSRSAWLVSSRSAFSPPLLPFRFKT